MNRRFCVKRNPNKTSPVLLLQSTGKQVAKTHLLSRLRKSSLVMCQCLLVEYL